MQSYRNVTRTIFLYTVRYLIPYMPMCFLYLIADVIGIASKRSQQAGIVKKEIRKILGDRISEKELECTVIKGISNHKKDLFEIWSFPRLNNKRIKKYAFLEGKEHLENALKTGNGALIAVSHFGSWKMLIAALAYEGYKVNQIGLDPRYFINNNNPRHHNLIMEIEHRCDQSLPANFIYIGKYLREVYRILNKNELVINSFDGFIGSRHMDMPFFNNTLRLALGPIILAMKSKAALIPTFAIRQDNNKHKIIIHEEIPLEDDNEKAIKNAAETYIKLLEYYMLQYPSHYCRTLYDRVMDPMR